MSKEDWVRAYERALNNGQADPAKRADEDVANLEADRVDQAMEELRWQKSKQ